MTQAKRTLKPQFRIPNSAFRIQRGLAYQKSGVDVEAADGWLARMRPLIRTTRRPEVLADKGQFAGLFRLAAGRWRDPVLVASTDGVGTKLKVAQLVGRHEGIGVDAVAMNTNDVLVYGAQPLFFLDYLAVGTLAPRVMSQLMRGLVRGCRASGCTLLGGETAEMPGVYRAGEYDLAGFCVGAVERAKLIDGSRVRAGDAIVGLASSGVHANGFSLVRRVFSRRELKRLAPQLLRPTRIYVKPVLDAIRLAPIHAIAHITGGGLVRRIPSLVAKVPRLRAWLIPGSWPLPAIFRRIQAAGSIAMIDMLRTFNMGLGLALVCRRADVTRVMHVMRRAGVPAWCVGSIERGSP